MAQSVESSELWKIKQSGFNNYFICNVCRLCANITDNVVPIFDKSNETGSIYSKLKRCLPSILVVESDVKPKQICLSCVSKLEVCCSFIEMSLDSDCKFEALLQNGLVPQIQVINEKTDLSWLQLKPEPIWTSTKEHFTEPPRKDDEQKTKEISALVELPALQQRLYEQSIVQLPTSSSSSGTGQQYIQNEEPNLGVVLGKQDTSLLQGLVVPEGVSPQDLIVLVELKCKDDIVQMKKSDLPTQTIPSTNANAEPGLGEMVSFQTKIVDTTGNIRIINLPDFDGKFTQSEKVLAFDSNVALEKSVSSTVNSTASFLKAFEADVLNGVLKLESIGSPENMLAMDKATILGEAAEKSMETSFENTSLMLPDTEAVSNTFKPTSHPSSCRDFPCTVCGKAFTRKNRLNAHLARHSSVRPHSCDKCDQRFITRWDLTLHLRIHSGVFSCEYCGKAFPAKGKLDRHRRTHTGERPFPCDQCKKAFSEKRNLENHLKTHAAAEARNKPNVLACCTDCGRQFTTQIQDKRQCDICEKFNDAGGGDTTVISVIDQLNGGSEVVHSTCVDEAIIADQVHAICSSDSCVTDISSSNIAIF